MLWKAMQYDYAFEVLPQLVPRRFESIMTLSASKPSLLPALDEILKTEPWVMGFSCVSTHSTASCQKHLFLWL